MSHIYITTRGASVGISGGRLEIKNKDDILRSVPVETIESVSLFGKVNISTSAVQLLLEKDIPVCFFSAKGRYFGRLASTNKKRTNILKEQFAALEDDQYCLEMSKKIIDAKVRNQSVILER